MQPGSFAAHHEQVYEPPPKADQVGSSAQEEDAGGGDDALPTVNVDVPEEPLERVIDWSKPVQYALLHPSPYESLMERVHEEPSATVALPEYGAPPLTLVPSVHESVQLTSYG